MALNLKTETVLSGEAPPAQTPLPPDRIAPHFPQLEILECLGRGGMGVVYKARQKTLNRFVALKLLAPERANDPLFAARFEKEARALAALNHPNIVTIYDHGQAGGFYFLLMEFVDGVTLRQLLAKERVSAREALAIVPQICDALQFAHDQGIVHRDIKPENILLDRRGRVKVADFGLAKIVGTDAPLTPSLSPSDEAKAGKPGEGPPALTDAGKVMGTPQYMSPEQIHAPGAVDHRADIYALGVVFYQMLTGELPGRKIEPPSKKVSIDVRLDEVVLRALEKNPELRFQQASILKTQVETIAGAADPGGTARERPEKFRPFAFAVALIYTLTPLSCVLCGVIADRAIGERITAAFMVIALLMVVLTSVLAFMLKKHASGKTLQIFHQIAVVCALVAGLIVMAFAPFFLFKLAGEPGAWNPNPAEALFVPLTWLGTVLLPISFWRLARGAVRWLGTACFVVALFVGLVIGVWTAGHNDQTVRRREQEMMASMTEAQHISGAAETKPSGLKFGPVLERVISESEANNQGLVFFDFETGSRLSPPFQLLLRTNQGPAFVELSTELLLWVKSNRMDVLIRFTRGGWDVMNFRMQEDFVAPAGDFDRVTADEVARVFAAKDAARVVRDEIPSAGLGHAFDDRREDCKAFRTRSNTEGVMQWCGLKTTPRGIKIRYKLVPDDPIKRPVSIVYLLGQDTPSPGGYRYGEPVPPPPGYRVEQGDTENPRRANSAASAFTNSLPLAVAVNVFNARYINDAVGKTQPPLTEDEVLASIRTALADRNTLLVSDATVERLERVLQSRRLPDRFELEALTGYQPDDSTIQDVWSVRLRVPGGPFPAGTTCIRIREVDLGSRTIGPHERAVMERGRTNYTSFERIIATGPVRVVTSDYENERKAAVAQDKAEAERNPFIVRGRVLDEQGNGLGGVTIGANCGAGTLRRTGTTESRADGSYELRFHHGIRFQPGTSQPPSANVQAATIYPARPGYFDANLNRQGDLLMGDRLPASGEDVGWKVDTNRFVLPNHPYELNFVMLPAAKLTGTLRDEKGAPLTNSSVSFAGKELPPSSSVFEQAKTDAGGRFRLDDLPTNGRWWLAARKLYGDMPEVRSGEFTLPKPGAYEFDLEWNSTNETAPLKILSSQVQASEFRPPPKPVPWGDARNLLRDVRIRLIMDRMVWRQGEPVESLTFTIEAENGSRGVKHDIGDSFAMEVDGKAQPPWTWDVIMGDSYETLWPGRSASWRSSFKVFTPPGEPALQLAPGKHHLRAVLLDNIRPENGYGKITVKSADGYETNALAFSNPVEVEVQAAASR